MKRRVLSMLLVLVMLLMLLPMTAWAEESATSGSCGENVTWTFDEATGTLTVSGTGPMYDYESQFGRPWESYQEKYTAIVVEAGVTSIGAGAFSWSTNLQRATISETVAFIGEYAFSGCTALTNIAFLGNPPEYNGNFIFNQVSAEVRYPIHADGWDGEAFAIGNNDMKWVPDHSYVDDVCTYCGVEKPQGVSDSGACGENGIWTFDEATGTLTVRVNGPIPDGGGIFQPWVVHRDEITAIVVEPGATAVGAGAFNALMKLTHVDLPEGITTIGEAAFDMALALRQIEFPESLTHIGNDAFAYGGMSSVTIPGNVETIGQSAFWFCESLESVRLENGVREIGAVAFGSTAISEITIPASVTTIGNGAFSNCSKLTEIWFEGDAPSIGEMCFGETTATAYYPAGNKTWTEEVMQNYDGTITWVSYDPEASSHNIVRLSGKTRYETAFSIANQLKENLNIEKFETVVVAYGQNFPDALTGSYLAAVKNAPILLTESSKDGEVIAYIQENLAAGGKVYILGGSAAVTEAFETMAKELGYDVQRVKGSNRYDTNLEILKEAGMSADQEILIATGTNYADSLSASATGLPMVLVGTVLTDAQKQFLGTTSGKFVILGGTAAVSEAVEAELAAIGTVERVKGKNRYETSVVIAQRYFENPDAVVLAYANGFPDGLCGGALAVSMHAPLILTSDGSPAAADAYVEGITTGVVTGGTARISDKTAAAIFDLVENAVIPKK